MSRKTILLGSVLAVCPDFDVFLLWIGGLGGHWHRGFSHSLVFGAGVGLAAWAIMGVYRTREALIYISTTLSHTFVDLLLSKGREGIELFWPFTKQTFKLSIISYLDFAFDPRYMPARTFLKQCIEYSLIELLLFAPLLVFSYIMWRRGGQGVR